MKIIVGSDFHGSRSAFELFVKASEKHHAELAVICGDITNFGTFEQARSLLSMLVEAKILTLFVPGNCDPPSLVNLKLNGLICIHGGSFSYNNLTFIGVGGGTTSPFNTPFEMREEEIAEILLRGMKSAKSFLQQSNIVLVSHTPPKNTKLDKTFSGLHVGSASIKKFIEEHKPLLTLCGHIHEARGCDYIGSSIIVNPGPAKQGNYATIFIEDGGVKVELSRQPSI